MAAPNIRLSILWESVQIYESYYGIHWYSDRCLEVLRIIFCVRWKLRKLQWRKHLKLFPEKCYVFTDISSRSTYQVPDQVDGLGVNVCIVNGVLTSCWLCGCTARVWITGLLRWKGVCRGTNVCNGDFWVVKFEVLMAITMKSTIFWDVTPCHLVEVYQRFRGAPFLHLQGWK
jgi:hypothetical protein